MRVVSAREGKSPAQWKKSEASLRRRSKKTCKASLTVCAFNICRDAWREARIGVCVESAVDSEAWKMVKPFVLAAPRGCRETEWKARESYIKVT